MRLSVSDNEDRVRYNGCSKLAVMQKYGSLPWLAPPYASINKRTQVLPCTTNKPSHTRTLPTPAETTLSQQQERTLANSKAAYLQQNTNLHTIHVCLPERWGDCTEVAVAAYLPPPASAYWREACPACAVLVANNLPQINTQPSQTHQESRVQIKCP